MLKRRAKISPNFSMASMTDLIFLLLIFFMITSTMVSPNAIKVLLPQGKQQTSAKPLTRVIIDKNLNYYAAFGNDKELSLTLEELTPFLQSCAEREPEMYIALYATDNIALRKGGSGCTLQLEYGTSVIFTIIRENLIIRSL